MFGKKKETRSLCGNLISGLPVPENSFVQTILSPDGVAITALVGKQEHKFNLSLDKVKSVQILNDTQVKQVIEQSAPGMIIGATAFGLLGAMIGGRVKTKDKTVLKQVLFIDYVSDGDKQIVLDVSKAIQSEQANYIKRFMELKPQAAQPSQTMEL